MALSEVNDFLAESEALYRILAQLPEKDFEKVTQFKHWTINDVLVHLHFWNQAVDQALQDPDTFSDFAPKVVEEMEKRGGFQSLEYAAVVDRGAALREIWISRVREMQPRWNALDPKTRIPWIGPSMSVRSAITARQMETWAHGLEVFDTLGIVREGNDRIRNIVILGINTFAWSQELHGLDAPPGMPALTLTAPSGSVWEFGDPAFGSIRGPATDFAAVVTQTRAVADTALRVDGPVAESWMAHAQCFVGTPGTQPKSGTRFCQSEI